MSAWQSEDSRTRLSSPAMLRILAVVAIVSCGSPHAPPRGGPRTAPPAPTSEATKWIAELANPATAHRAVQELDRLADPAAIVPLGNHFLTTRDAYPLGAM